MAQIISLAERKALFGDDDKSSQMWAGDIFQMSEGEVIPFRYADCRYLLFFLDPVAFLGGDQAALEEIAPHQSDGFVPHPMSRLLKFFRADAETEEFKEDRWPLPSGRDIFSFCRILTNLVSLHAEIYDELQQYFYLAASPRLATLYKRLFREVKKTPGCVLANFESILTKTGEFDGYERKAVERESAGDEAARRAA